MRKSSGDRQRRFPRRIPDAKRRGDAAAISGDLRGFNLWVALAIIVAGVVSYGTGFDGVFLLDDGASIVRNEAIQSLWPIDDVLFHRRRPVVNLSLAINYALGKLKVWGYHAFNLGVHILAGLALFGVVRRTLLLDRFSKRWRESSGWVALVCALLWVVHPLQTQSVTYIIQRGESMMGLFYLLTLYCVIRGHASPRGWVWYGASVVACVLGMGCKAVMATAPLVVTIYDRVFLADSFREVLRRRLSLYLGLALSWGVLVGTGVVTGVLFPQEGAQSDVGFGYGRISPWAYLLTQSEVILHYLKLSVWPGSLCLDYGWPVAQGVRDVVFPGLVVVALLAATVWLLWRRSWLGFVGAWFFIILAPTSSFIPIKDVAFEHRMYLPLAAVVVLCVAVGSWAVGGAVRRWSLPAGFRRPLGAVLTLAVVVALAGRSNVRNRDYRSSETMWRSVVAQRPEYARAHYNLGHALMAIGRNEEAIASYQRALAIYPNHVSARYNLGQALLKVGRLDEAIAAFERVVQIDRSETYQSWKADALVTTFAQAHNSRGNALLRLGRTDEAIEAHRSALALLPGFARAYYNLGNALAQTEAHEEAIEAYRAALSLNPRYAAAHANLGKTYYLLGLLDEAEAALRAAIALDARMAVAHYNLGALLQEQGKLREAVQSFAVAARLAPDNNAVQEALRQAMADWRSAQARQ